MNVVQLAGSWGPWKCHVYRNTNCLTNGVTSGSHLVIGFSIFICKMGLPVSNIKELL